MSTKKKWLDLSSFGAQLVVTPKTDLRNQAAIIKIKDVELLEKKLNTSLNSFLTGLKQTGKFVYITNEQNNDLSFMYKSSQDSLSLADIKSVFPYDSKNDLIEMDMSDIYLQNPMSSAEKTSGNPYLNSIIKSPLCFTKQNSKNRLPQIQPLWVRLNNSIKQI
ncbi:hypothetical protein NP567_01140 (plasmid) [Acinetobacter baumannii]|nr:hypothetical protein NP567_01140 [Acinetobacter baumannii]WEH93472.1 hypothetical protein PYR75_18250 [Acinetobacter soli]